MSDLFDLTGKTVLVTGAGRGLGRAIADALAERGAAVFGTSRDAQTAAEIAERYNTIPLVFDARNIDGAQEFIETLTGAVGLLDALVNNAGVNIPKPSTEVTSAEWNTVVDTNLSGPFFVSTAIARTWVATGTRGVIVNIASQAGIVAIEERAAYGASKAGLIHLTKLLAAEWAEQGIRVNGIAPTFVRTEMTAATLDRKDFAEQLLSRIPMGRFGEPEDLIGAVVFMLSDASAFVTGQTLLVDGGYTLR